MIKEGGKERERGKDKNKDKKDGKMRRENEGKMRRENGGKASREKEGKAKGEVHHRVHQCPYLVSSILLARMEQGSVDEKEVIKISHPRKRNFSLPSPKVISKSDPRMLSPSFINYMPV